MNVGADRLIPIQLPATLWASIDATIDDTVDMASIDGDEETVAAGLEIRRAGRAQVPGQDGRLPDEQWPPVDTDVTIALTREQWQFALDQVVRWHDSHTRPDDGDGDGDTHVAALISAHLQ